MDYAADFKTKTGLNLADFKPGAGMMTLPNITMEAFQAAVLLAYQYQQAIANQATTAT